MLVQPTAVPVDAHFCYSILDKQTLWPAEVPRTPENLITPYGYETSGAMLLQYQQALCTPIPHHVCHTTCAGFAWANAPEHAAGLAMLRRQPVLGVVVQAAEQLAEARPRAALPQRLRRHRLLRRDNCAPHAAAFRGLLLWARCESAGRIGIFVESAAAGLLF